MTANPESPVIWALTDDRAGNVAQALGVAEALGVPFSQKQIRYSGWGRLHNGLRAASRRGLELWSRKSIERGPPPQLIIAAGRRTAPLARWFKRRFGSRLVQLMDPGWPGRSAFDLIAAPLHDNPPVSGNVIRTLGACHRASPVKLAQEASLWAPRLPDLPRPWTLLAVGGATVGAPLGAAELALLAGFCSALPGSLLVVTSRRTGPEVEQSLRRALPQAGYFRGWGEGGDSPYLGLLALADRVVVTGDSMSMCSEACATGAPVHIFAAPSMTDRKFRALHQQLFAAGYARALSDDFPSWHYSPLNPALIVREEMIRRKLI